MQKFTKTVSLVIVALVSGSSWASYLGADAPLRAAERERYLSMDSEVLGASRKIVVRVPRGYDSGIAFGTVVVLDAQWLFPIVADYIDFLSYWGRIPPLIVVGIPSTDRNADLIPWVDPAFPGTGTRPQFAAFLNTELPEFIGAELKSNGRSVLVGHSFGGVMALHGHFMFDDAFDATIAVGTSVWVSGSTLMENANAYLSGNRSDGRFLYMAVAEADGGATVPAGQSLADMLAARAPDSLDWYFEIIPQTDHFAAVVPAVHRALEQLFPSFGLGEELVARVESSGAEGLTHWFSEKNADLGWRFWPVVEHLKLTGLQLAQAGKMDAARALMEELRRIHPADSEALAFSGLVERHAGEYEHARRWLERAIEVATSEGYFPSRISMYQAVLDQIPSGEKDREQEN